MADDVAELKVVGLKRKSGDIDDDFEGGGAAICNRSSLKHVVNVIKQNLDEANLRAFQQSCFGRFLGLTNLVFQGPLFFYLMRNLDESSRGEGVLRFNVNDMIASFGPEEFLSITGMSFGPVQNLPTTSTLQESQFPNQKRILLKDMEERFKEECVSSYGGGENALKLALNLFLYGALLGRGFVSKKLNMDYFHVVDSITSFNSYPWGRECYDFLVYEFFKSAGRLNTQMDLKKKPRVDVYGFTLALQVWAFEVYPQIGNECAEYYAHLDPVVPRIFRWICYKSDGYKEFDFFIKNSPPSVMEAFTFSIHEAELVNAARPYNHKFRAPECRSMEKSAVGLLGPVKRKLRFGCQLGDIEEEFLFANPTPLPAPPAPVAPSEELDGFHPLLFEDNDSNLLCIKPHRPTMPSIAPFDSAIYMLSSMAVQLSGWVHNFNAVNQAPSESELFSPEKFLVNAMSSMKDEVESLKDLVIVHKEKVESSFSKLQYTACGDDEPFLAPMYKNYSEKAFNFSSEWIEEQFDKQKKLRAPSISISEESALYESQDIVTELSPNEHFLSPSTSFEPKISFPSSQASANCSSSIKAKSSLKYSPMQKYRRDLLLGFLDWYRDAKNGLNNGSFRIPLRQVQVVDFEWIHTLMGTEDDDNNPDLSDEHCDVLLNLMIFKSRHTPHMFNTQWCCVEYIFWTKCARSPFEAASELLLRYVRGELPLEGSLPWCDAKEVYGIVHVNGNHWVAYAINLVDQNIVVYDSMAEVNDWEHIKSQFGHLSRFVPRLIGMAAVNNAAFLRFSPQSEWPILQSELPPQQMGISNCGIMAMKFIECLASGFPIHKIEAKKCTMMRLYYCGQLFNAGKATEESGAELPPP